MKKIFSILFFIILIAKVFPDENGEDKQRFGFLPLTATVELYGFLPFPIPEIATAELGVDTIWDGDSSSPYWKFNLLNLHFISSNRNSDYNNHLFDIEVTPVIITKNWDVPSYNFSFINFKIGYNYFLFNNSLWGINPFLGINYLNLKEGIFDFNTINLQAGVRIRILSIIQILNLFYIETGYAYKNDSHNWYFSIGTSPFWIIYFLEMITG